MGVKLGAHIMGNSYQKVFEVFENKELRKVFGCKRQKVELLQNGVQILQPVPQVVGAQGDVFSRKTHGGSRFGFVTLILPVCRKRRSHLSTVLTRVCSVWRCYSSFPIISRHT